MKKIISMLLIVACIIGLVACSKNNEKTPPGEDPLKVTPETISELIKRVQEEEILSANIDSSDEDKMCHIKDLSGISDLAEILKDASYEEVERPKTPYKTMDGINIQTEKGEYSFSVINESVIRVTFGAKGSCYTCDKTEEFLEALKTLQEENL